MTTGEKLQLIERALGLASGSLTEETQLNSLPAWDSLTILNLQIELSAIKPDMQFDDLYQCDTAGEICAMI